MRYLSAQLAAYLEDELWLRNARHANDLARRLLQGLERHGMRCVQPVEANEVFAEFPAPLIAALRSQGFEFYEWPAPPGIELPVVRLVTAYDMQAGDVDGFINAIGAYCALNSGATR